MPDTPRRRPHAIIVPHDAPGYVIYTTLPRSSFPRPAHAPALEKPVNERLWDEITERAKRGDAIRFTYSGTDHWYQYDEKSGSIVMMESQNDWRTALFPFPRPPRAQFSDVTQPTVANPGALMNVTRVYLFEPGNLAHEVLLAEIQAKDAS